MIPISTTSKQDFRTPGWLREALMERFEFTTDAAADNSNSLVCNYIEKSQDALSDEMHGHWAGRVFCNPPYSRQRGGIGAWLKKGYDAWTTGAAELVVFLLPANTGTRWFAEYAPLCSVEFIAPRVAFEDKNGATQRSPPHASMLMIFGRHVPQGDPIGVSMWAVRG